MHALVDILSNANLSQVDLWLYEEDPMPSSKDFDITALLSQHHQIDNQELLKLQVEFSKKYSKLQEKYITDKRQEVLVQLEAAHQQVRAIEDVVNWRKPYFIDNHSTAQIVDKQVAIRLSLADILHAQGERASANEKLILASKKAYLDKQLAVLNALITGHDKSKRQNVEEAQAVVSQKKQTLYEYEAWCYEAPIEKLAEERSKYLKEIADAAELNNLESGSVVTNSHFEILERVSRWRVNFIADENSKNSLKEVLAKIKQEVQQLNNTNLDRKDMSELRAIKKQYLFKESKNISEKLASMEKKNAHREILERTKADELAAASKAKADDSRKKLQKRGYQEGSQHIDWSLESDRTSFTFKTSNFSKENWSRGNPSYLVTKESSFDNMLSSMAASTDRKNSRSAEAFQAVSRVVGNLPSATANFSRSSRTTIDESSPTSKMSSLNHRESSTNLSKSNRNASISSQTVKAPADSLGSEPHGQYLSFMAFQNADVKLSEKQQQEFRAEAIKCDAIKEYLNKFITKNRENSKGVMLARKILEDLKLLSVDQSLRDPRMDKNRPLIKKLFDTLRRFVGMPKSTSSSLELKKGLERVLSTLARDQKKSTHPQYPKPRNH